MKNEGKRSQLFCEHCKRINHTVDKCYKLHGYPNTSSRQGARNKGFRTGNNDLREQSNGAYQSEALISLPGLNQEQSKQLMQFLTSLTAGNDQRSSTKEAAHTVVTLYALSVVHCFYCLSHETWILDSGASDHMCSDKALLHDISMLNAHIMVNL